MSSGEVPDSNAYVFELSYGTLFMDVNRMVLGITVSNDVDAPHCDFAVVPTRGVSDPVLRVELACHRDGEGMNLGGAVTRSEVDSVRAGGKGSLVWTTLRWMTSSNV